MPVGIDIISVIRSDKPIFNGSMVCGVDRTGNIQVIHPDKNRVFSSGAVENKLTTRFDDPTYYTA